MNHPLRVLCLDIEGGHGGSSRSLFEVVRMLDPGAAEVEVWCKRDGPIHARYRTIGIPTRSVPQMPKMSALPSWSRNLWQMALTIRDFVVARGFLRELQNAAATRFDLIHLNHEGLFLLGQWLRGATSVPVTTHVRTMPRDTLFARWQAHTLLSVTHGRAYITENERKLWHRYAGCMVVNPQTDPVVHNPVAALSPDIASHPAVPQDSRLRVACLANCAWSRGNDRLLEIAQELQKRQQSNILFVVAGDQALRGRWPGDLAAIARKGGTLADAARARGVEDYFQFLGHIDEPERVLAAVDVVIKPTREANPWGRDVLEAMAAGRPVISVGTDQTFVETNVTGILFDQFNPSLVALTLIELASSRDQVKRLGEAARTRVLALCDGRARAADLLALWRNAVQRAGFPNEMKSSGMVSGGAAAYPNECV